jgi:hypothetical protein
MTDPPCMPGVPRNSEAGTWGAPAASHTHTLEPVLRHAAVVVLDCIHSKEY